MGWALHYTVKWGRPLTGDEANAFKAWCDKTGAYLEPTADTPAFESWRGLVPDDVLEKMSKKPERPQLPKVPGADYQGFLPLHSEASFRKAVRMFLELEKLFPFAEILLTDDYHLKDVKPSAVDFKNLPTRDTDAPHLPPPVPDEPSEPNEPTEPVAAASGAKGSAEGGREGLTLPDAPELRDEIAQALERARKDFEIWKNRKK